jgi:hypothetical protein
VGCKIVTQLGYENSPLFIFLFLRFDIYKVFIYLPLLIVVMTRISLDVSAGTFTKIEAICKERFQNKAQYLRMVVEQDIAKRPEGEKKGEEKIGDGVKRHIDK